MAFHAIASQFEFRRPKAPSNSEKETLKSNLVESRANSRSILWQTHAA